MGLRQVLPIIVLVLAAGAAFQPGSATAQFEPPSYAFSWYVDHPQGVAVDPAGHVYTISRYPHLVSKYERDGTLIYETGEAMEPGASPAAIETDASGDFYLVLAGDNGNSRLVKCGPDGSRIFIKYVSGTGQDVTVGSDGNVYVTSTLPNTVTVYTPDGEPVDKRSDTLVGRLSADDGGHYYLTDNEARILRKCALSGEVLEEWPVSRSLHDVDVAPDGTIVVVGAFDVSFYSPAGTFLGERDGHGPNSTWLGILHGADTNAQGDLYLADYSSRRVHMFGTRQEDDDPPYPPDVWPPKPPEPWPLMTRDHPASVMLHLAAADSGACLPPGGLTEIVTEGRADPAEGVRYFVYLLATPNTINPRTTTGMAGLQLGIDYRSAEGTGAGLAVHDWHLCAVLDFADDDWPAPGTGNTICWGVPECQKTDVAVAGYFTVTAYSAATMSVVPWPNTGLVKVADCSGAEGLPDQDLGLDRAGWVSLGGGLRGTDSGGCNPAVSPCAPATPVERTTWGRLKSRYR